ncbi:MAG: hypothetical protein ACTHMC_02730 [Pseudobacter sp.]|uniref:hypothetical protein n=1 Tax=Pseudobacter sp. TaxID=2045420 RepID=UPI003F812848
MQQMAVDEKSIVKIDYTSADLPFSVREFRPTVYSDREGYNCLLGPDTENGIFGTGVSIRQAVNDWDRSFSERLLQADPEDEVVQYIRDTRAIHKKDVW